MIASLLATLRDPYLLGIAGCFGLWCLLAIQPRWFRWPSCQSDRTSRRCPSLMPWKVRWLDNGKPALLCRACAFDVDRVRKTRAAQKQLRTKVTALVATRAKQTPHTNDRSAA